MIALEAANRQQGAEACMISTHVQVDTNTVQSEIGKETTHVTEAYIPPMA